MTEFVATGRRKTAVARVFLRPGTGEVLVNGRSLEEYFPRETLRMIVGQPFELTGSRNDFRVIVNVAGGGISAQAQAIRHGLTRALVLCNPGWRSILKQAGFITRDPRAVERKKYGRHKARKRPQYSKR